MCFQWINCTLGCMLIGAYASWPLLKESSDFPGCFTFGGFLSCSPQRMFELLCQAVCSLTLLYRHICITRIATSPSNVYTSCGAFLAAIVVVWIS